MRKLLLKSLLRAPLTERAPPPDERGAGRAAAQRRPRGAPAARPLARRSARSTPAPATAASSRSTRSTTPFYDLERFGLRFVASPRHADVLLVTGPVTHNMREALERTYAATPDPKWVVAVGDCAVDGGVFAGSYAVRGGVSRVLPVDLHIRGCPPRPTQLLEGLLALLEAGAPVQTRPHAVTGRPQPSTLPAWR